MHFLQSMKFKNETYVYIIILFYFFLIRDKRHYQLSVHGQDRKKTMRTKRARGVGQAMSVDGD